MGMAYGFGLAFLPGPAFFKLLLTGLQKGFRPGLQLALGIVSSDFLYLLLVYFGISALIDTPAVKYGIGIGGGIILVIFGLAAILKNSTKPTDDTSYIDDHEGFKPFMRNFAKGFTINALNPAALFFWVATVAAAHQDTVMNKGWDHFGFFAAILLSVFGTDLIKTYLAKGISRFLTPRLLNLLNKIIGASLLAFGIKLLLETTGLYAL